jgi:hypothetical protein
MLAQLTAGEAELSVVPVHSPQDLCIPFRERDLIPRFGGGFSFQPNGLTRARPWSPDGLFAFRGSFTGQGRRERAPAGFPRGFWVVTQFD